MYERWTLHVIRSDIVTSFLTMKATLPLAFGLAIASDCIPWNFAIWWHDAMYHKADHYLNWPRAASCRIFLSRPVEGAVALWTSCPRYNVIILNVQGDWKSTVKGNVIIVQRRDQRQVKWYDIIHFASNESFSKYQFPQLFPTTSFEPQPHLDDADIRTFALKQTP